VESQEEIADMEEKFRMMHLQIEQLRGKIKEKEEAIVEQHSELQFKSEAGASASMRCRSRRGARRSLGRPPDIRMAGNSKRHLNLRTAVNRCWWPLAPTA